MKNLLCMINSHKWVLDETLSNKEILQRLNTPQEILKDFKSFKYIRHCTRKECNVIEDTITPFRKKWEKILSREYECCVCESKATMIENPKLYTETKYSRYLKKDLRFCSKKCLREWIDSLVVIMCPHCGGKGEKEVYIEDYHGWSQCHTCGGTGQIRVPKENSFIG